jgi:hypothetical protein|nr:MAG TPA: hypothetical protein [Caudoviricetes sp.]
MNYDDIIIHYGVKGMKWGVRKKISDFGHRLYDGHKENLLYKYRTNGYSEKDAQEKLRKRLRNEKIGAAGLTGFVAVTNEIAATSDRKSDKEYQKKYGRNKR